jgi:phenylalanyl-tRNA synthetase beta chain
MPTIDISFKDLKLLLGVELTMDQLEHEAILRVKGEIDGIQGDTIKVDCKDSNRPDLWSTEGMARLIKPLYDSSYRGIPEYKVINSDRYLHIDRSVDNIRPFMVLAVAKNVKMSEELLKQLIQLQEKICLTFGRKRKVVGGGIFDLDMVEFPLTYKAVKPEELSFVPLGYQEKMNLKQVLEFHPKGVEYKHLLENFSHYPVLVDRNNDTLTMPPITNSNKSGKVTTKTKNLLIEMTGTDLESVHIALRIFCAALADRGAQIESVTCDYGNDKVTSPDFTPKKIKVKIEDIESMTGLKMQIKEWKELLDSFNYNAKRAKDCIEVEYPSWRADILHPVDVIEDILISYGFKNIVPELPDIPTVGGLDELEQFAEDVRNLVVGFGAQELLNFTMTNVDYQFKKMNTTVKPIIEIANPVSQKWSAIRAWITPTLIEFFSNNTSQEYPQQIYEVGDVLIYNKSAETGCTTDKRLGWALADNNANFTKAKQFADYVLQAMDIKYEYRKMEDGSFIKGRGAKIYSGEDLIGFLGEIHPQVLDNFGLQFPVCSVELDITKVYAIQKS